MNKKLKIALITLAVTVVLVVAAVLIATLIKPSPEAEPYALPSAGSSDSIVTETPSDESGTVHSIKFYAALRNLMTFHKHIDRIKTHIVAGRLILLPGVSQSNN